MERVVGRDFVRAMLVLCVLAGVLAGSAARPAVPAARAGKCANADIRPGKLKPAKIERATECLLNKRRGSRGRDALKSRASVAAAADRHSRRMVKSDCFEHRCSGEPDLRGRLHATGYLPCSCRWQVAENIAWGDGKRGTARSITKAWMRSSEHRRNILTRPYEHFGVGVERGRPGRTRAHASVTFTLVLGFHD